MYRQQSFVPAEANLANSFSLLLACVFAVSAFVFFGIASYTAVYVCLLALLAALLLYLVDEVEILVAPSFLASFAGLALLAATLPFVFRSPQDLVGPLLMTPLCLAPAAALILLREQRFAVPGVFATLCLVGAGAAFAAGLHEILTGVSVRVGLGNNPIHFGAIAVILGFMALLGVISTAGWPRYLFLLGPVFAFGNAIVSASRGPFLAAVVMTVLALGFLLAWMWRDRGVRWGLAVLVLLAVALAGGSVGLGDNRVFSVFNQMRDVLTGSLGSEERTFIYLAALRALGDAPIFGHGYGQMMDAARVHFPALAPYDHLHSDVLDFGVMGGGLGLLSYLLLVAAPLLLLLDGHARRVRPVVLGAAMLSAGYFVLGLTNATFGVLPQTLLFAAVHGVLFALLRSERNWRLPGATTATS